MKHAIAGLHLALLVACSWQGQAADGPLEFEGASVKRAGLDDIIQHDQSDLIILFELCLSY